LAEKTGRPKQHLITELLGDRLADAGQMAVGRVEALNRTETAHSEEVLTLEEVAALLKLPPDVVKARVEDGELPGRRFGAEWRFARTAVLGWLADGEPRRRRT
jgi:excisionase family DNA binding protein